MKRTIQKIATGTALTLSLTLMQIMPVLAVTEDEVAAHGKEATAGSIFIWFLCAIAFLKISQKIDSFMSSLGINVGHTGGSMMAEFMIAAKGLTSAKKHLHWRNFSRRLLQRRLYQQPLWYESGFLFVRRTGWSRQPPVFSKRYEFCYRAVRQSHQQKSL